MLRDLWTLGDLDGLAGLASLVCRVTGSYIHNYHGGSRIDGDEFGKLVGRVFRRYLLFHFEIVDAPLFLILSPAFEQKTAVAIRTIVEIELGDIAPGALKKMNPKAR